MISRITNVQECDMMITTAQGLKNDLEFRKIVQEKETSDLDGNSDAIASAILKVQSEISKLDEDIAKEDDADELEIHQNDKKYAEYRLFRLQLRKDKKGLFGLHDSELELARTVSEITVVTTHIGDLEAKKAELLSAA